MPHLDAVDSDYLGAGSARAREWELGWFGTGFGREASSEMSFSEFGEVAGLKLGSQFVVRFACIGGGHDCGRGHTDNGRFHVGRGGGVREEQDGRE